MSRNATLIATFTALAEPACTRLGLEFVDVRLSIEGGERVARIVIDRERADGLPGSSVSLEDCQGVSRDISIGLDEDPEQEAGTYRLEVSSPGLERPLVRLGDYDRFSGREVRIKTFQPIDARRIFEGQLLGTDGSNVRVECSGQISLLPIDGIAKAHLVHRFK